MARWTLATHLSHLTLCQPTFFCSLSENCSQREMISGCSGHKEVCNCRIKCSSLYYVSTASISNKIIHLFQNKGGLLGITRQTKSNNLSKRHLTPPAPKPKGKAKINVGACKSSIIPHKAHVWTQNTEQLLAT